VLLDCEDPLFACLERKEVFTEALFGWIFSKVLNVVRDYEEFPLEGFCIGTGFLLRQSGLKFSYTYILMQTF
jgi:hypothetical protein